MSAEDQARFEVDADKCIRCGRCMNVCTGMVLEQDAGGVPYMKPFERFGWRQRISSFWPTRTGWARSL